MEFCLVSFLIVFKNIVLNIPLDFYAILVSIISTFKNLKLKDSSQHASEG